MVILKKDLTEKHIKLTVFTDVEWETMKDLRQGQTLKVKDLNEALREIGASRGYVKYTSDHDGSDMIIEIL